MKTMRRVCASSVLALTLTLPVFGGDIHFGVTNPPPPPSNPATSPETDTTGAYGDISTTKDEEATVIDPVVEAALRLARVVLALF
jgi:hypothetical protein